MLTIKTPELCHWSLASFYCLDCELRTYFTPCSSVSIVNFEQAGKCQLGHEFCCVAAWKRSLQ